MPQISLNLPTILAQVRQQALALAANGWPELGALVNGLLPDPLPPLALLPIATGYAVEGQVAQLLPVAAAVLLVDVALRIMDDLADAAPPPALYHSVGSAQASHYALALNTVALRAFIPLRRATQAGMLDHYFQSFLRVCQGQIQDLQAPPPTLAAYEAVVKLKTLAAYEFSAGVGAQAAGAASPAVEVCITCGAHLGWMIQILDDLETLWFPVVEDDPVTLRRTFPALWGLTQVPAIAPLAQLLAQPTYDRHTLCTQLDALQVRPRLMHLALDHRDQALALLSRLPNPEGGAILSLCLDWFLRDAARLLPHA